MFIGHFGLALAAKKRAPEMSLGTLFLACQWPDLLWPVLVLLGVEKVSVEPHATAFNSLHFESYPWSHGFLSNLLVALGVALACFAFTKKKTSSILLGVVAFSHWVLDLLVHRPDLPLLGDSSAKVGLGLWNSVAATVIVESGIFFGGLSVYLKPPRSSQSRRSSRFVLGSLVLFLTAIYALSIWGPQPEPGTSPAALAGPALAMWILIPWAAGADRR